METNTYQEKIEQELSLVQSELEAIATKNAASGDWEAKPSEPADDADANDAADVAEESIERQAIVADLETRYRNLQKVIEKIAAGTYGVCELCGNKIETERLDANPASRTCIADKDRESELVI